MFHLLFMICISKSFIMSILMFNITIMCLNYDLLKSGLNSNLILKQRRKQNSPRDNLAIHELGASERRLDSAIQWNN